MMKCINYLTFIAILIITSTGLSARADFSPDIEALNSALVEKFEAGEIAEMAELYAQDAVMLPPSSEILNSPEAIKRYWNNLRQTGVYDYSIYEVEHNIVGDVAYATALWEARKKIADGRELVVDGNISNVYEKQRDGSWKIRLQSWN